MKLLKNRWGYLAIGYCAFVIGFGWAHIGILKEQRKEGERYGWEMPLAGATLVLPVLLFAYRWGRDDP